MVKGLGDLIALGMTPGPDCFGSGRTCRPACRAAGPKRSASLSVKAGCGCSGLSGLKATRRGMGDDLIDFGLEQNQSGHYDPNAEMLESYYTVTGGTKSPPVWSDILLTTGAGISDALKTTYGGGQVPVQTQQAVYRSTGAPQGDSSSMWPLLAMFGVAALLLTAG